MKKIIVVACVAVVAAFAGYNVYSSQTSTELSNLMLANVEALAYLGENSGKYFIVSTTNPISETDYGEYKVVVFETVITCPPGGNQDCISGKSTFSMRVPKG